MPETAGLEEAKGINSPGRILQRSPDSNWGGLLGPGRFSIRVDAADKAHSGMAGTRALGRKVQVLLLDGKGSEAILGVWCIGGRCDGTKAAY